MKKLFRYLFFLYLCPMVCDAQVIVNSSEIVGTRWKMVFPDSYYQMSELELTSTEMLQTTNSMLSFEKYEVKHRTFHYPYYLSNEIPGDFDFSKVGKTSSGKYLVFYNSKQKRTKYYTIRSFDSSSLIFFYEVPETDKRLMVEARNTECCFTRLSKNAPIEVRLNAICCKLEESSKTAIVDDFVEVYLKDWGNGEAVIPSTFKYVDDICTITSIKDSAFMDCHDVKRAIIPSSVKIIGSCAFRGCINMTSVQLPVGITSLEPGLFQDCEKLDTINIPVSVTHVMDEVFEGCRTLSALTLPAYVKQLGNSVFSGCSSLKEIVCNSRNVPQITDGTFDGFDQSSCTLKVPTSAVSEYRKAEGWKDFNIVGGYYTETILDWSVYMQSSYGATLEYYANNYYLHLSGPNGGYNVWLPAENGNNSASVQPTPNSSALSNGQGFRLSTIFAKDPVTLMYQRAKALGIPNASCTELLGKNDVQINSYYGGVCGMAGTFLNMSATEAAAYAKKLYDAYVDFQNNRVTPDGLTALCGGCTLPRYNSGN